MKKNIFATTTVIAAMVGIAQIANADSGTHQFTPLEKLPPELRQQVSNELAEMLKDADVDWDNIVVGLNENGEITLRARSEVQMQAMGSFSCLGAKSDAATK